VKKICYVATIPAVVHAFLRSHIVAASKKYSVTVICNAEDKYLLDDLDVKLIILPIERKPSIWKDAVLFCRLAIFFRQSKFDIVHSIMPKAGLLAMLAARLAGTSVCIHTFTGQIWMTRKGVSRSVYKFLDKCIAKLATVVLADSQSQLDFLLNQGVLTEGKAKVIGAGSICGVNFARFLPDSARRKSVRHSLDISDEARVILFVGRLNRDKGMLDLAEAFEEIAKIYSDVVLLLVGSEENVLLSQMKYICQIGGDRVHHVKFTATPENFMAAADVFCLPSYREGFGLTIIEAAACGVPAVASKIYGITDAVDDGKTGLLFPAGDVVCLTQTLLKMIQDADLRRGLGDNARKRAHALFSSEKITQGLMSLYDDALAAR